MTAGGVPAEVDEVFREVRTCEFTTLARDSTPITWPTVALYQPEHPRFVITTSIGLPQKAFNVRRTPRVALLYSDRQAVVSLHRRLFWCKATRCARIGSSSKVTSSMR